ncbi:zinc finger, CCHC-type containing protein [Tanacetum coccineum]
MEVGEKTALMKKAYSTLVLCLGDWVLQEVTKETSAEGIWMKLSSLYMTKSLTNRLYLKKTLYTYYMSPGTKLGDHIDEFNKLILDLVNIDIEIEDGDQALMLLTSLPSSYENFVETLYSGVSSQFKSRGGTSKLKCFICHSEGHLKRDCLMKKSSGFVKKGGSYHMTHRRDFLYDFKVVDGGLIQLGDNMTCTIKGTGKVKIQLHDGSSFILEDVRYVSGLRRSWISLGTLEKEGYIVKMQMGKIKHGGSEQVGLKQLGSKQVGFKQLGHKQVGFKQLGDREAEVFQVSNDDAAVAQRRLEDKKLKEKTNTDCLVKE